MLNRGLRFANRIVLNLHNKDNAAALRYLIVHLGEGNFKFEDNTLYFTFDDADYEIQNLLAKFNLLDKIKINI